ncbi:MAG: hypothetical protein ACPGU9_01780 [Flavobacteriaceae bacterium]
MSSYNLIEQKIQTFIKKYYTSRLLKGVILFLAIGLLYFLGTLFIEHMLWLTPVYRTILFWVFIAVEVGLLYYFIGIPIFKLTGLQKGISKEEASKIIGNHFPEINDKLTNLLQLKTTTEPSELLLASIDQKAKDLSPIPFKLAVNLSSNTKYIKYALLPILIIVLLYFTGHQSVMNTSYERVINHSVAYTPPAPFNFIIQNNKLQVIKNQSFTLQVTTKGTVIPEHLKIHFANESYFLKQTGFNTFEYEFTQLTKALKFQLSANTVTSQEYVIDVIHAPSILNFELNLEYPKHTFKTNDKILNTGSVTVPEGTKIKWVLTTETTDNVEFKTQDTVVNFLEQSSKFTFQRQFFKSTKYQISTHNSDIKNYENLKYTIETIKDDYPEISVQTKADSLDAQIVYVLGKISDDYGLRNLKLKYKVATDENYSEQIIPISQTNFEQFTYQFPGNLNLKEVVPYEYYFEVSDNDALHNFKTSKSQIFNYQKLTDSEVENKLVNDQKESISNLSQSLNSLQQQEQELNKLSDLQKEKKDLNWNDKTKLQQFFKRQQQQEQLMQKFNKELQRNLEEFQKQNLEKDEFKEALQDRLKIQEQELEKNEALLKELEQLKEKIKNEELFSKIEQLSKQHKSKERSLEQILELTKRYYVNKKFEKLSKDLSQLAKKQNELSKQSLQNNTKEAQDSLTNQFDNLTKELDDLNKENDALQRPMNLDSDKNLEQQISKDQQNAAKQLEKKLHSKAQQHQKKAAQKMQDMSQAMQMSMQSSSSEQLEEDEQTLRQILDNLITFSFDQEHLLLYFKNIQNRQFDFPNKLKQQHVLKEHFKHIDDSLFALSLRVPKISETILNELSEAHFNIDKSLERFADQKIYLGVSNQQYALTSANNLANLLGDILKSMQDQLQQQSQPGAGQCQKPGGSGSEFQLSDIIKKQDNLIKKMKDGQSGSSGKPNQSGQKENGQNPGSNLSEEQSGELFSIYKQQQVLKHQLQDAIKKLGLGTNVNKLANSMNSIENQLLEKGFDEQIINQMLNLKHQLLKLDEASFEQGQDNRRQSNSNTQTFINSSTKSTPAIEQYFNEIEILNRHALPLHPIYKQKVKHYFKHTDD